MLIWLTEESALKTPEPDGSPAVSDRSDALPDAGLDEAVEVAVEHCLGVAVFEVRRRGQVYPSNTQRFGQA
ncbi:MAG: hypothetical protein V5A91_06065 [Candidatus Accumulibacter necessarius]